MQCSTCRVVFTVEYEQCLTTGDLNCLSGKSWESFFNENYRTLGNVATEICEKDEVCETLVEQNQVLRHNFDKVLEVSLQRGCRLRPNVNLPAKEKTSVASSISRCSYEDVCPRSRIFKLHTSVYIDEIEFYFKLRTCEIATGILTKSKLPAKLTENTAAVPLIWKKVVVPAVIMC